MLTFHKQFTLQEPIPAAGVARALQVMENGRLHRYNVVKGEESCTDQLEMAFAAYMGSAWCLACASCGSALHLALRSAGVRRGDGVLCNAYTLAPVPGAIHHAGGEPILVDMAEDTTMDLDDLDRKAAASGARFLLLSHMRGHISDMDKVMALCRKHRLTLIEDCAHTMGAYWNGRKSGSFGVAACFSTQTYKHMNSGEGGLLTTSDPDIMARAIVYSGSYMHFAAHRSRPPLEAFDRVKYTTPNYSCRMDNLRAAILLPQLEDLDRQCARWNALYAAMEKGLRAIPGVGIIERKPEEQYVGSSIQFFLPGMSADAIRQVLEKAARRGVEVKWFGNQEPVGFTSDYTSWRYMPEPADLPAARRILAQLCDMRLPLTFTEEDCAVIATILGEVLAQVQAQVQAEVQAEARPAQD